MADENGRIFWYNRRWYEYTGTTLEEMQGWGWKAALHPNHLERVAERIERSWISGEVGEDTFPLRGKDGRFRWFLSRALPVRDEAGRIVRWFGTNTDVTKQRQAEEALREADRRKDEFIAMLAHELRNPLAPLRHGLEIQRLAGSDLHAVERARAMMERQVNHMVRLVDDLLDVSRISRGLLELRMASVGVRDAISHAVEAIEPQMRAVQHALCVLLPPHPLDVTGDSSRLPIYAKRVSVRRVDLDWDYPWRVNSSNCMAARLPHTAAGKDTARDSTCACLRCAYKVGPRSPAEVHLHFQSGSIRIYPGRAAPATGGCLERAVARFDWRLDARFFDTQGLAAHAYHRACGYTQAGRPVMLATLADIRLRVL